MGPSIDRHEFGEAGIEVMVINIGVELGVYEKLKLFAKHNDIIIMSMNQQ